MLIYKLALAVTLLLSLNSYAQNSAHNAIRDVTKATFLSPGFAYEKAVGQQQSVYVHAALYPNIQYSYSSSLGTDFSTQFEPGLLVQYRHFYNLKKRAAKGKRTDMNSGNYVAGFMSTSFFKDIEPNTGEQEIRALPGFGAVWGLQRNGAKRFSLDLNLGAGYFFSKKQITMEEGQYKAKYNGEFAPVIDITLGFWLNKRD